MSERFKFALSQAFEAQKEGVVYYTIGGRAVVLVSLFIAMPRELIRYMKIRSM
jgi:hypothetical protein